MVMGAKMLFIPKNADRSVPLYLSSYSQVSVTSVNDATFLVIQGVQGSCTNDARNSSLYLKYSCTCPRHEDMGSGGTAPLMLDLGTRWSVKFHALTALSQWKHHLVRIAQKAGRFPETFAPVGKRAADLQQPELRLVTSPTELSWLHCTYGFEIS